MSRWIHEMKWPEVAEYLESNDTVLIPVGSTEQHGAHMAMMTDAAEAIDVAHAVAEQTGVLITPPLWFGWTPHHMSFAGTIGLRAETLSNIVEDICISLTYHGFKKLILINGHRGANLPPLEIAQARVRNRTNCYMALVDVQLVARKEIGEILDGDRARWGTPAR
jgi:creatinine amidohydrolase